MRNPETVAAAWHWADLGLACAVVVVAAVGVIGHYRLRKSYARWHLSQPDIRIA